MAINVEVKESFSKAPAGQYQAVCAEVVDLGFSDREYTNQQTGVKETRTVHEIQYHFQLNKADAETGKRYEIRTKKLNLILSEKSNLRAFLTQWRGHDLTPEELRPPGVDVDLTGRNALIQVIHTQSGDKTYANIGSIMPLMEGMPEITTDEHYQKKQPSADAAKAAPVGATAQAAATPQPVAAAVPTPNAAGDIPF